MIKFTSPKNPIHQLAPSLQEAICFAQDNAFEKAFLDSASFLGSVFDQLRIRLTAPKSLSSTSAPEFVEKSFGDFTRYFAGLLQDQRYPEQAIPRTSIALATRAMLLRAFADPDAAVSFVRDKVISVVESFPKTAADIEVG